MKAQGRSMACRSGRVEVFNTCRYHFLKKCLLGKTSEVVVKQTNGVQVFVLKGRLLVYYLFIKAVY